MQEYDRSLADFDALVALDPSDAENHSKRAAILLVLGKAPEAFDAAGEAIQLGSRDVENRYLRGSILTVQGKCDAAIEELNLAIEADPDSAKSLGMARPVGFRRRNTRKRSRIGTKQFVSIHKMLRIGEIEVQSGDTGRIMHDALPI